MNAQNMGDNDDADLIGGEELRSLSCLLPRKKKGKLCIAPKTIACHIIVSAQQATPTALESQPIIHQNPSRPSYPKEVLKHHFVPYGAHSGLGITATEESMEVESSVPPDAVPERPREEAPQVEKESKGRKRKKEGKSPKKSKKHKSKE
ncbi:hypothetical protein EDC04DRAFT_2901405 [Pisolithus marmoratus]|nr:hypothetical protein EDC04DRAFT_2901405 [Pisolithus marmoratus]